VPKWHELWLDEVRDGLGKLDWEVLSTVAPYRHTVPEFMVPPATSIGTTVEEQLRSMGGLSREDLVRGLRETWRGSKAPIGVRSLLRPRKAAVERLTTALWEYWCVAFAPYWPDIRSVLQGDLIHREGLMANVGLGGVLATLHDDLRLVGDRLYVDKPDNVTWDLTTGIILIPSVFVPPHLVIPTDGRHGGTYFVYGAHRFDRIWYGWNQPLDRGSSPLDGLIGSTRANILVALEFPDTTLSLARRLRLKPPGVSQHLSALKNSGLLKSRRNGKAVLYYRTALADRLLGFQQERIDAPPDAPMRS
jgi:DNA-binding transcriptional ArsR family regulator